MGLILLASCSQTPSEPEEPIPAPQVVEPNKPTAAEIQAQKDAEFAQALAKTKAEEEARAQRQAEEDARAALEARQKYLSLKQTWQDALNVEAYVLASRALLEARPISPKENLNQQDALLWNLLNQLDETDLARIQPSTSKDVEGWKSLLQAYSLPINRKLDALQLWQRQNASHPANDSILPLILARLQDSYRIAQVAVLLPLSDKYAPVGKSIQQGILKAYYQNQDHQIILKFYDTAKPDKVSEIFDQALADGADWIIGPVQKPALLQLQQKNYDRHLMLNWIEQPTRAYQFTLSNLGEAQQLAEWLASMSHQRLMIIYPNDEKSLAFLREFRQIWLQDQFHYLNEQVFEFSPANVRQFIENNIQINRSRRRHQILEYEMAIDVETDYRARRDIDAMITLFSPQEQKVIQPQLAFNRVNWPVYAISRLAPDQRPTQVETDLNGLKLLSEPWLFEASLGSDRLEAFGVDAWQLIQNLPLLQSGNPLDRISGETGFLWLDKQNRVNRWLKRAEYTQGSLRAIRVNDLSTLTNHPEDALHVENP